MIGAYCALRPLPAAPIAFLRQQGLVAAVIKTKSSLTSNATVPSLPGLRAHSHSAGFGVRMSGRQRKFEEVRVFRRSAPAIVLFAALAPPMAHAQVNIDQDKTPAHIYASDCAVCHKSIRGLANGRGGSALTGFLAEHYTSSSQEAAALAAYVLAGGGGVGTAAPVREEKPQPEHARAAAEEPKTHEARRPAKPEEEPAASAKPQRPSGERGKPERVERSATAEPGRLSPERKPPGERREPNAATRTHGRPKPAEAVPPKPEPATVAAAPTPAESSKPEVSPAQPAPSAAAPQQSQPDEASPAPTDNIPD